jgi:hypothetical protein
MSGEIFLTSVIYRLEDVFTYVQGHFGAVGLYFLPLIELCRGLKWKSHKGL